MWTTRVYNLKIGRGPVNLGSDFPGPGSRSWRPAPVLIAVGAVGTVVLSVWAVFTPAALDRLVAVVIAVVLAAICVIGWRRRLVGGPRGLLVGGIGGHRMIPWSQVRTLTAATNRRAGLTSITLEVDLVDDDLLVFGRTDLGADPAEVLAVLRSWAKR